MNARVKSSPEIKIGLIGASGKMGREVLAAASRIGFEVLPYFRSEPDFEVPFKIEYQIENVFVNSCVIINFSPEIYYSLAEKRLKPMLLCSTGHPGLIHQRPEEGQRVDWRQTHPFAFMYAPNVSVEWCVLKDALEKLSSYGNFEICIDDIHHSFKKDAPSGTVKNLNLKDAPKVRSIRCPDVSSWHIASLFDRDQVVRIEHQVLKRSVYAESALKVAAWLAGKAPGEYGMADFLREIHN